MQQISTMRITLNNEQLEIPERQKLTVQELIEYRRFSFKLLVIKINGTLIPKSDYSSAVVNDGDEVLILHLMSGG